MDRRSSTLFAGLLMLLAGCAVTSRPYISEPVGPAFADSSRLPSMGYLQVYSETITHNDGNIFYYPHTSYTVHSREGRKVKAVQNHVGLEDESPTVVPLPPGAYNVIAQSAAFGRVTVPVVIKSGALTPVFLERDSMPDRLRKVADGSEGGFVKGPDGKIVGWRVRGTPMEE